MVQGLQHSADKHNLLSLSLFHLHELRNVTFFRIGLVGLSAQGNLAGPLAWP